MAKLINCKTCTREMASNLSNCPHCGAKKPTSRTKILVLSIVGFFIVFHYYNPNSSNQAEPIKATTPLAISNLTYSEIDSKSQTLSEQNFEEWAKHQKGKRVEWTGRVTDVQETISGKCEVLVDMNNNEIHDVTIKKDCAETKPFNQGSKITFDGKITDIITILKFPSVSLDEGATLYHYE